MHPMLLADAAFAAASGIGFALVARSNLRRAVDGSADAHHALGAFATWWGAFAAYTLANGAKSLFAGLDVGGLPIQLALAVVGYACLCLALWALTTYLVFVYQGRDAARGAIRAYFVALFVLLSVLLWWTMPTGLDASGWTARILNARPLRGFALLAVLVTILGPPPALAIAYARLHARTDDPAARRRIRLVSGALIAWFALSIVANATALVAQTWWPLAARSLAVLATALLVRAFVAPRADHAFQARIVELV